jgi:hypothetical protein
LIGPEFAHQSRITVRRDAEQKVPELVRDDAAEQQGPIDLAGGYPCDAIGIYRGQHACIRTGVHHGLPERRPHARWRVRGCVHDAHDPLARIRRSVARVIYRPARTTVPEDRVDVGRRERVTRDGEGISPIDIGHAGHVIDTHHYHRHAQNCDHRDLPR